MKRVKIGVIGCGAIAQIQHMPNLAELHDLFEVTVVCDISAATAEYVAGKFNVPRFVTDYRDLLEGDVDAVLHCAGGYKPAPAVAAFEAGKHLFIEKPLCASLKEVDRISAARQCAGVVGQVGYMKAYDPAFEYARRQVASMSDIQFVQVNHLHPNNALHLRQFDVRYFEDASQEIVEAERSLGDAAMREAIGDVEPAVQRAFRLLSGSMIHDLYGMRIMLGLPKRVVHTEVWREGRAITYTLEYPAGHRCVASWVDLVHLWDFKETLEVYGDDRRVIVSYPTGFTRGILSTVTVQGIDEQGTTFHKEPAIDWESAFVRELRHFHECIIENKSPRTLVESARDDVALIIDIIKRYTG
jgi:predicted dehydrogenase